MPTYVLKRYQKVVPSVGEVWHLGREVAFEAADEEQAIAHAKEEAAEETAPYARLVVLVDLAGKCLMEVRYD